MPADFWVGNTSVYQRAIEQQPGQLVFDPVRFYRATERFNARVSVVIEHPDTGETLGVLSVGVNVEEALFTEGPRRGRRRRRSTPLLLAWLIFDPLRVGRITLGLR